MRYLLMISADESRIEYDPTPEAINAFTGWLDDLQRRGVIEAHEGLEVSNSATTVRVRDDQVLLTDGPYMEAKEQIGGFVIINVDDLDDAIQIAAGHPACSWGQVEIRPIRQQ